MMNFPEILTTILSSFKVRYVDFDSEELKPYKERKIGGLTRIDRREILIAEGLSQEEEDRTWVHEILSIHYYLQGILKHDKEIEEETREICHQEDIYPALRRVQGKMKSRNNLT